MRDECEVGPLFEADVDDVFEAWKTWCDNMGRDHHGTKQTFGRDLRAVVSKLETKQVRSGGKQRRRFVGVGLKD